MKTPEGWTDEHQEHLEALLAARKAEDEHIRWLVSKELEKFLPEYVEAEQEAAEKVQACYEALRDPETDLAAIDKQIGEAEGFCISWETKLTDSCYRPRYLNIQRLNYLWTVRHSSAWIQAT